MIKEEGERKRRKGGNKWGEGGGGSGIGGADQGEGGARAVDRGESEEKKKRDEEQKVAEEARADGDAEHRTAPPPHFSFFSRCSHTRREVGEKSKARVGLAESLQSSEDADERQGSHVEQKKREEQVRQAVQKLQSARLCVFPLRWLLFSVLKI